MTEQEFEQMKDEINRKNMHVVNDGEPGMDFSFTCASGEVVTVKVQATPMSEREAESVVF